MQVVHSYACLITVFDLAQAKMSGNANAVDELTLMLEAITLEKEQLEKKNRVLEKALHVKESAISRPTANPLKVFSMGFF